MHFKRSQVWQQKTLIWKELESQWSLRTFHRTWHLAWDPVWSEGVNEGWHSVASLWVSLDDRPFEWQVSFQKSLTTKTRIQKVGMSCCNNDHWWGSQRSTATHTNGLIFRLSFCLYQYISAFDEALFLLQMNLPSPAPPLSREWVMRPVVSRAMQSFSVAAELSWCTDVR